MLYSGAYAHVGTAATDISGHCRIDVRVIRGRVSRQQRGSRHDLSGLTVSALHHFKIEPGLLDLGPRDGLSDTLDRRDGSISNGSHGKLAGSDGDTVQMYGARAALRDSTAELGAREAYNVSENPQQWHVGGDIHILCFAVDQEIDHLVPSLPATLDNTTGRLSSSSKCGQR
jgi:hypothetical protein